MKPKFYTLKNKSGMALKVSSYGGVAYSLMVPDRDGKLADILMSCPDPVDNLDHGYMGALIGRVGNRISNGGFAIDGQFYALEKNELSKDKKQHVCHLHGGTNSLSRRVWEARQFDGAEGESLELTTFSPDGEDGYPGNLFVRVVYTIMEDNAWKIEYWAMTDRPTIVNLTNHAYFNLNGGGKILDHMIQVNASRFTEVANHLLPTGRVLPVEGTSLDLRDPQILGDVIGKKGDKLMKQGGVGIDHNFVLDRFGNGLSLAAILESPRTGRQMSVWTTEPCLQVYSGNAMDEGTPGKGGATYGPHCGICFETQHAPDSQNMPGFPSIRLDPGQVYHSTTLYAFEAVEEV